MGVWQSKAAATSPPAGWSNLPPELLDLVLRRLPSLADRVRFIAVCRHWLRVATRYSAPHLPRPLPWINFHDGSFRSLPDGELHSLRIAGKRQATCIGSFGCWLLFEQPPAATGRRRRRRQFLMNPLRPRTVLRLPSRCREPVDLPAAGDGSSSYAAAAAAAAAAASTKFLIGNVIVCSSDLVIAIVNYNQSSSDVVVCCRPGLSSSWSTGICQGVLYHDMALYNGKVYTVTCDGDLFAHELAAADDDDTAEPRVARVKRVILPPSTLDTSLVARLRRGMTTSFLVISAAADKLLMVQWSIPFDYYTPEDSTKRMTLKVFEADFETSQWLEVKCLDDQVLFVGSNSCRAISVSTQGHGDYLQGNKIYFVDNHSWYWRLWLPSTPRTCCVYDMSSDTIQSISLGETHVINHQVEASWFFPHG